MDEEFECIECGEYPLVFEGHNEYEPDPITGEKRCFNCHVKEVMKEHDCWENAQPYEFEEDGHRFHGWECGICGELLQTG